MLENYKPNEPIFTSAIELGLSGNNAFYKVGTFNEEDVERFADICLLEQKKQANIVEVKDLNLFKYNEQGSLVLCSINNIEGVNDLNSCQSLEFSPQGIMVVMVIMVQVSLVIFVLLNRYLMQKQCKIKSLFIN